MSKNYYGSLCTTMYEILHKNAPKDELEFYFSYAKKEDLIFEPLCGSGRFLVPFLKRGFDISGIDLSAQMLAKLKEKPQMQKHINAIYCNIKPLANTIIFLYLQVQYSYLQI